MTTAQHDEIQQLALEADIAVGGGLRAVEVAAIVLARAPRLPAAGDPRRGRRRAPAPHRRRSRAHRCGARDTVRARPALPRASRRPPGAARRTGSARPPERCSISRHTGSTQTPADVDRVAPHGVQRDLRRLCLARLGDAKQAVIQPHRHHARHHLTQPRTNLVTEADAHHPLATGVGVADLEVDQRARGIDGRPDDADRIRQRIEHRDDQRRRRAQQRLETLVLDAHRPTLVRRRSRCSHRPATGRHGVLRPAPREQHRGPRGTRPPRTPRAGAAPECRNARRCRRFGLLPQSDRLDGPRAQRPPGRERQGEQRQQR